MQGRDDNSEFLERFAIENGASVNKSGGFYVRGQMYSFTKKLGVPAMFQLASSRAQQQGKKVKPGVVARECRLSNKFMMRVRHEFRFKGEVVD